MMGHAFKIIAERILGRRNMLVSVFSAHLSTTCSRGAYWVVLCPLCIVRRASSVVHRQQFLSTSSPPKPLG